MEKKLISVVVPVYNTDKYLSRCFNSLIHPNIKAIVINDGSTDNSQKIINNYCQKYPDNFITIKTKNRGAVHARRLGLKYVDTPYFGYCDSDDFINTESYISLCQKMHEKNIKIGNGRMTVYLPNILIPLNSRKWKFNEIDFKLDKQIFSNVTVSLLDKIFHRDLISDFDLKSDQKVYEDMEIVCYVLAKYGRLLHSNNCIYNYCMRSLKEGSTSAIGLDMKKVDGLQSIINATVSIKKRLKEIQLYEEYKDELEAISIKLCYQRIVFIIKSLSIKNKKELINIVLSLLDNFCPGWENNPYYLKRFKSSEWNDYIFYIVGDLYLKLHGFYKKNRYKNNDVKKLLDKYNKIIS